VVTEPFEVEALTPSAVASVTERRWQLRVQGSYAWSAGPVLGVSAWWMRGSVVPRTVGVTRDLELDERTVPGSMRLADPWTVDVRVEWPVSVAVGDLGLIVEVRNLFDRQAPLAGDSRWAVSSRPDLEGPRAAWGEPLRRQAPRSVWAGARWSWR
jgi:hypothetical protein